MGIFAPAALAAGVLASTTPAAGAAQPPAVCLWAATPPNVKAALIAQAATLKVDAMDEKQAEVLVKVCKLPETREVAAFLGMTLRSNSLMAWSRRKMVEAGATPASIDAAWAEVGPKTRLEFSRAFEPDFKPSKTAQDAVTAMARRIGLAGGKRELLVFAYVGARSVRERLSTISAP